MIYIQLFFEFLKVGAFAFGGGYAMLSLIGDAILSHNWMNERELLDFIGVETVIPGPIAVNMATYVGYEQGGFLGAFLSTTGVILPSFIITLLVLTIIKNLLKYMPIKVFIESMRPALCGLILAVASTMGLTVFFGIDTIKTNINICDWPSFIILATVIFLPLMWKRYKKKEFSSIILVIISGLLGILLFGM